MRWQGQRDYRLRWQEQTDEQWSKVLGMDGQTDGGLSPEAIQGVGRRGILMQEQSHVIQGPVVGTAGFHELWVKAAVTQHPGIVTGNGGPEG